MTTTFLLGMLAMWLAAPVMLAPAAADTGAAAEAQRDLYNPARVALVNARRQVAESSSQEQEMLVSIKRMHAELDSSIALLADAQNIDPSIKTQLEAIRQRLSALGDSSSLCPMGSDSSLKTYDQILDELQGLIDQY